MGCKNSTAAKAEEKPAQGVPTTEVTMGEAVLGTKVYTDMGTGVVGEVKAYGDTQIMVIQMDVAGTMSCPLDRLEEMKQPKAASPASPSPAPHAAVGVKVQTDMGAGVVQEVKTYGDTEIMVIQMDVAGTMSCPLDRLEEMTKAVAAACEADVTEGVEPLLAATSAEEPEAKTSATEDVSVCFGGWCRPEGGIKADDLDLTVGPAEPSAEVA